MCNRYINRVATQTPLTGDLAGNPGLCSGNWTLAGNWTCYLQVCRLALNPLGHISQGRKRSYLQFVLRTITLVTLTLVSLLKLPELLVHSQKSQQDYYLHNLPKESKVLNPHMNLTHQYPFPSTPSLNYFTSYPSHLLNLIHCFVYNVKEFKSLAQEWFEYIKFLNISNVSKYSTTCHWSKGNSSHSHSSIFSLKHWQGSILVCLNQSLTFPPTSESLSTKR